MKKIKNKGYTLIEILLALGLIAMFIVSVFYLYNPLSKQVVVDTSIKNAAIIKIKSEELLNGSQLLSAGEGQYNKVMLTCISDSDDAKECFEKYDLSELYYNRGGKNIEYSFNIRTDLYSKKEGEFTIYGIRDADTCVKIADNFARVYGNVSIGTADGGYNYSEGDDEGIEEYGEHNLKNLVNHCEGFNKSGSGDDFYSFTISTDTLGK